MAAGQYFFDCPIFLHPRPEGVKISPKREKRVTLPEMKGLYWQRFFINQPKS